MFENAKSWVLLPKRKVAFYTFIGYHDHLTGGDVPHKIGSNDIQGAGFRA